MRTLPEQLPGFVSGGRGDVCTQAIALQPDISSLNTFLFKPKSLKSVDIFKRTFFSIYWHVKCTIILQMTDVQYMGPPIQPGSVCTKLAVGV